MKNVKKISKLLILMALLAVVIVGCTNRTHQWGHKNATVHIARALELNDTQSQELEVLMNEIKQSRLELCAIKRDMEARLKKELVNDELNVEVINSMVAEEFNKAEVAVTSIMMQVANFHSTLNDEQKEKVREHLNKGEKKWHSRHRRNICDEVRG